MLQRLRGVFWNLMKSTAMVRPQQRDIAHRTKVIFETLVFDVSRVWPIHMVSLSLSIPSSSPISLTSLSVLHPLPLSSGKMLGLFVKTPSLHVRVIDQASRLNSFRRNFVNITRELRFGEHTFQSAMHERVSHRVPLLPRGETRGLTKRKHECVIN